MKSFIAAVLFAAVASAQSATLPTCAETCALSAIGSSGGCSVTDAACLCKSQGYLTSYQTCVESSCDAADQQTAATFGYQYCASAGVTITATPSVTATATDASASSSAASSFSSAASSVSSSVSVSSSSSASASSASKSASSASSSASSMASASSSSASASASSHSGAAPTVAAHWEVLGLGAAALVAML